MPELGGIKGVRTRIHSLLDEPCDDAGEALDHVEDAVQAVQKYQDTLSVDEIRKERICVETFDLLKEYGLSPGDYCLTGISALCGVHMFLFHRTETALDGEQKKVRLLATVGCKLDLELARLVYVMLDDTICNEAKSHFANRFDKTPTSEQVYQVGASNRINRLLNELAADHHRKHPSPLVEAKDELLMQFCAARNLKSFRGGARVGA